MRILVWGFILVLVRERQYHAKGGAAAELGVAFQRAPVFFDDARGDGQAQAGAFLFGGEEGVEHPLPHLGHDALAGVAHLEDDHRVGAPRGARGARADAQGDRAAGFHALDPVLNQVDEHLLDLVRVHPQPDIGHGLEVEPDGGLLQLGSKQRAHAGEQAVGRDGEEPRFGRARELEEILHDPFQAQDFVADHLGVLVRGRIRDEVLLQAVQPHVDGREGIADFMGHAGRERAQGGELFLPRAQGAAFAQLDAQRSDDAAVNGHRHRAHQDHQQDEHRDQEPAIEFPPDVEPRPADQQRHQHGEERGSVGSPPGIHEHGIGHRMPLGYVTPASQSDENGPRGTVSFLTPW